MNKVAFLLWFKYLVNRLRNINWDSSFTQINLNSDIKQLVKINFVCVHLAGIFLTLFWFIAQFCMTSFFHWHFMILQNCYTLTENIATSEGRCQFWLALNFRQWHMGKQTQFDVSRYIIKMNIYLFCSIRVGLMRSFSDWIIILKMLCMLDMKHQKWFNLVNSGQGNIPTAIDQILDEHEIEMLIKIDTFFDQSKCGSKSVKRDGWELFTCSSIIGTAR